MTAPTNPFAPNVPAAPQPQAAPAPAQHNPYAQPAPAAPAPVAPQAYAQPALANNPYAQQSQTAPQTYAAPAPVQQQAAPPAINPAGLVAAGAPVVGEGKGAKLADMYGRLVLIFPLSLAVVPRNPQYITNEQRQQGNVTQERLTATVVVLDDGQGGMQPIGYGGQAGPPPIPHSEFAPLPYVRKAMWINQSRLISQLRDHLPAAGGQPGMVCGRVVKAGPAGNDPWYLQGATEQELHLAGQYLQGVQVGHFPHPLA
jgi:hypothetical protein